MSVFYKRERKRFSDGFIRLELHRYADSVVNMLIEVWGPIACACTDPESLVVDEREGPNTNLRPSDDGLKLVFGNAI